MGESVFENCIDLESADLGETGITILPEYTFYGDQKLTSAVIPAGMDKWEAYSFYDTGFKTLTVTCANLAGLAISMCPNLETVSFDNSSLTSLKKHSLYQLPKLKEIDFGKYITKLEEKSIYDCQTFDSLVVTENMKSIDQSALFYPTTGGLKTVMFKAKDFTALADYSDAPFEGKEIKLYIDPSVKNIPAYTFAGTQITNSVEITDEQVYDATAFYGAFLYNIDWHYPTITSSPFKSASVENLTFSDITEIPDYLWSGCYISNIWLDGIEKIGDYAFESTDLDNYNRSYTLTIPASVKEIGEYAFGENNSSNLTFEKGTGLTIGKEAFSKTGYYNNIRTNYTKDNIPTAAADAFKTGSDCEIVFAGTCDDVTAYQSADGWKDIKTKKWDGVSSFNVDYELVGAHFPRDKYKLLNYMIHLNGGSVAYTPFGCSNTGELSFDDDYCDLVFDNWPDETTDKNSYKPVITSDTIIKIYVHENVFDVNLSLSNPATEDVAKIKTANYYKYFNDEEVPVENTSIKVNSCMEGEAVAVLELSDEEHYNFDGWYDEFSMPLTSDYELGPLTMKGNYIARVEPYNYSLYVVHDPSCVNCELKTNDIKISGISEGIWGGSELLPYKTKAEIEFIGAKSSSARYLLDHWADYTTGEEISKDNPYEVTVLGYTQIYPVIKAASQYAITAVSSDDKLGTAVLTPIADAEVEPAGSKIYWEKSKIHLKALEKDAHYHFVEWQASPSGKKYSTSDVDVEVDGSATSYLAVFKKDTFTVSVTVSGIDPSLVEITGAGKQGWGDETTLSCTIKDTHYHFVSWTSGLTTTTDPTLKLTVKERYHSSQRLHDNHSSRSYCRRYDNRRRKLCLQNQD